MHSATAVSYTHLDVYKRQHIEVIDSVTIQGYRFSDGWARDQHIYFRTRFSKPFEKIELDTMAIVQENKRIGTATIARFDFNTQEGEQIPVSYTHLDVYKRQTMVGR